MKNGDKAKDRLMSELEEARRRIAELEGFKAAPGREDAWLGREVDFFQGVFDAIQDGISVLDSEFNVIRVNSWMEKMYASEMPLVGRKCYAAYQKRTSLCPWCPSIKTIETGKAHSEIVPCPSAEKPAGWIEISTYPLKDANGFVAGIIELVKDITERKRLDDALLESENRFRNLMEYIPGVSIQGYKTDGTVFYWNKASEEVYGYTVEEAIGRNLGELIVPPELRPLFEKCLETGKTVKVSGEFIPSGEMMLMHKEGHLVPVYSIHTAVYIEGKEPLLFCIDVDLSKRKRMEEDLKESEEKYRNLFETSPEAVFLEDMDGGIVSVNQKGCEIYGYSREEMLKLNVVDIVPPDISGNYPLLIDNLGQKRFLFFESRARRKNGESFQCDLGASLVKVGNRDYVQVVIKDISARKLAEKELAKHRYHLEELVKERTAQLTNANERLQREIAERKRAEETLRYSEERYRQVVSTTTDAIMVFDAETRRFIEVNKACEELYGYSREEFLGITHTDIAAEPEKSDASIRRAIKGKLSRLPIRYHRKKDGAIFPVEISSSTFMHKGRLVICGVIRDITENKKAEEALIRSEAKSRSLIEALPDMMFTYSKSGIVTGFEAAENLKPIVSPGKFMGKHFGDVLPADVTQLLQKTIERAFQTQKMQIIHYKLPIEGQVREYEGRMVVIGEDEVMMIVRDITEHKQAEAKLRLFSQAVESSVDGIAMGAIEGRFTYVNESFVKMFGYSREELIGKEIAILYPEKQIPRLEEALKIMRDGSWAGEMICKTKNGELLPVMVSSSTVIDKDGNTIAIMANHRDITAQKRAEEELKKYWEHLEELVGERTEDLRSEISERKKIERELKRSQSALQVRKEALEQKNIALREVLEQIEVEKREMKNAVAANVEELLLPILRKLRGKASRIEEKHLDVLEDAMGKLTSLYGRRISEPRLRLTPREIEICTMIKSGLTSKEISELLHISLQTTERHRNNIRRKLDITRKKINLATYLQSL